MGADRDHVTATDGHQQGVRGVQALKGVSFELAAGEVHALVGENGAGKSTLIKVVTGAHPPDEGTLEVQGQLVVENDPVRARTLGIAAIYQQPALFPDLTVAENIALGPGTAAGPGGGSAGRERRGAARRLLDRIGAAIDPETEVRRLTMPEQQLVEIARALGAEARILIMDEPTASLSDTEVDNLFRVIRELKAQGVGIIYISHRLEELPQIADRVTALRDGVLVGTRRMDEVTRADLIRLMVGRELSAVFPKTAVPIGEVVLERPRAGLPGVGGARRQPQGPRRARSSGWPGWSGAGRTELARVLFGLTPADSGRSGSGASPSRSTRPGRAVALGIAYVPEDRRRHGVILEMSVAANTTPGDPRAVSRVGLLDSAASGASPATFVKRLGIKTASIDAPVGNLSGGNQQKVALARWLATEPSGPDPRRADAGGRRRGQGGDPPADGRAGRRGLAIVMISSELPEILGMSDRIAVMHGGTGRRHARPRRGHPGGDPGAGAGHTSPGRRR